jgi:riboflavin synthase
MFTGIVTDIGEIMSVTPGGSAGDRRFVVRTRHDMAPIAIGASIACSGCCLTVIEKGTDWFAVEVSGESLAKTHLGDWSRGSRPTRTVAESATSWAAIGLWPCRRHGQDRVDDAGRR